MNILEYLFPAGCKEVIPLEFRELLNRDSRGVEDFLFDPYFVFSLF